jgi:hypothetical protein
MLVILLQAISCDWHSATLGKPLSSRLRGENLLVSTRDGILALLNAESGAIMWRQKLPRLDVFDIVNRIAVAATSNYFWRIDGDNGLILNMTKHGVSDVRDITITNQSIAILGRSVLEVYNRSELAWRTPITNESAALEFSETGLVCGDNEYDIETGEVRGKAPLEIVRAELTFQWRPTVLEAFNRSNFLWRIDEPLYNSTVLAILSKTQLFVKNQTDYFVFETQDRTIPFIKRDTLLGFVQRKDSLVLKTPKGISSLSLKKFEITKFKQQSHAITQKNLLVTAKNTTFAFPEKCVRKCTATSQNAVALSVADCPDYYLAVIMDHAGRVRYSNTIDHAEFGTCWSYGDSLSVSYYRPNRKTSYVTSWGLSNTSQRTFTTENLIVAADHDFFALGDGRLAFGPGLRFHGALAMRPGSDPGTYVPDVKLVLKLHAFEDIKRIIEWNGHVVVQNFDVHLIAGDGAGISGTLHLVIMGVALFLVFIVGVSMCSSKTESFWT